MATNRYITITTSDNQLSKQFGVLLEGYKPSKIKAESIVRTLDGKIDASRGKVWKIDQYMIRVPFETQDQNLGTLDDLDTFYSLNNPGATPSDILTITDHFGVVRTALFTQDFSPAPLGIMIDGPDSYYVVNCTFEFIEEIESS